ncbi:ABC transporter substrate-binding protein [Caballeronia sp. DA-9]|uniref:ABC transporter substrate-binding protein n=1 Tax=Caballeronia sp. DA-9 TaxID=3436237 RepID=UPI003F673C30
MRKSLLTFITVIALAVNACAAHADNILRVGTTPAGAPFTYVDLATGETKGFMADLVRAIAQDNHFEVTLVPMQFSTLVSALSANKIDIIAASISPTEERKKVVNFSQEVYTYGEGLMVPASDTKTYTTVKDLKGDRVGTIVGTDYTDVMRGTGVFKEVVTYDSTADIMRDIEAGRLNAGFGDYPVLADRFAHARYPKLRLVDTYQPIAVGLGISLAVRKDEGPLLQQIDASINRFREDGTLKKLLAKWNLK